MLSIAGGAFMLFVIRACTARADWNHDSFPLSICVRERERERERQLSRYLGDYRYTHKSCEKSGLGVGWCSLHGSAARILSNVADDAAAAAVRWLLIAAINRVGGYYGIAGTWGIYIRCWWRKGVDACGMVEWSERLGLICSLSLFLGYGRKNVYTRVSRDCAGNQW